MGFAIVLFVLAFLGGVLALKEYDRSKDMVRWPENHKREVFTPLGHRRRAISGGIVAAGIAVLGVWQLVRGLVVPEEMTCDRIMEEIFEVTRPGQDDPPVLDPPGPELRQVAEDVGVELWPKGASTEIVDDGQVIGKIDADGNLDSPC